MPDDATHDGATRDTAEPIRGAAAPVEPVDPAPVDRIDADHSNAYTVWQRLGSPESPSPEQYAQLEAASELASVSGPSSVAIENTRVTLAFTLPRQAVSLLILEW